MIYVIYIYFVYMYIHTHTQIHRILKFPSLSPFPCVYKTELLTKCSFILIPTFFTVCKLDPVDMDKLVVFKTCSYMYFC